MWGFLLSLPIEWHTCIIFQCSLRPELADSLEMLCAFRLPQVLPSGLLILPLRTWVISTTVYCKGKIKFLHDPIVSFGLFQEITENTYYVLYYIYKNKSSLVLGIFGPVPSSGFYKVCILLILKPSQKIYLMLFWILLKLNHVFRFLECQVLWNFFTYQIRTHTIRLLSMVVLAFRIRFVILQMI